VLAADLQADPSIGEELSGRTKIRSLQIGNVWFEERQGGLARVYYELFRHLPQAGVEFQGLVIGSRGLTKKHGSKLHEFAAANEALPMRMMKARQLFSRVVESSPVDLVASHFALYSFPMLDRLGNRPLVVHFHGPWAAEAGVEGAADLRSRLQHALERKVYARAARFIVLSRAFAKELVTRYGVRDEDVRIIPAGVDLEKFNCEATRTDARRRLGWPTDRPIILAVRRLAQRMGLEDLVAAASELVRSIPEVLIYIAGTGVLASQLQAQIDCLGLKQSIKLLGRVEDDVLPLAYRAADISVVPTVSLEGFGMITLESLACGTPVMVTPIGGLPEVVRDLSPNLLFEATGAAALAQGLSAALRGNRNLPSAADCRVYAEANFRWETIVSRIRNVYAEALA
jgi:glycosyltransferase involved in cell wall biosynthesis